MNDSDTAALAALFVPDAPAKRYAEDLLAAVQTYGSVPDTLTVRGVHLEPRPHDPFPEAERQRLFRAYTPSWPTADGVGADLELYLVYDPRSGKYGLRRVYYRWRSS